MLEIKAYLKTLATNPLITFIVGVGTGAAGKYLADKYTERRRAKELNAALRQMFQDAASMMPELIKDMQEDLGKPENRVAREFVILPNKRVSFSSSGKKCVCYFEDEHQDLMNKVKLLENCGFIYNTTETRTPKYGMTEEFVNCLLRARIKRNKIKI